MQAFFDKELAALKSSQSASNDERYRLLEREFEKVKQDYVQQQANSKRQMEETLNKMSTIEKHNTELMEQNKILERNVEDRVSELSVLTQTVGLFEIRLFSR